MNIARTVEPPRQHRVTTPVGLVEAYFAAFGAGDIDGALAPLTEDVIWHVEDAQALLANITAPTLVICGDADRATPVAPSREIATAIPSAQIEILPGVGHHPPLEASHEVQLPFRTSWHERTAAHA